MSDKVKIGVIGGGLMGREVASAFGRWFVLEDHPVQPELIAVCDVVEKQRDWFKKVPSVKHFVSAYEELLAIQEIEVVYVAVPHNLHLEVYTAVLNAGKDLFAEKPFGIDLAASKQITNIIKAEPPSPNEREETSGHHERSHGATAHGARDSPFVRCSSEFPFFPGAQRVYEFARSGGLGRLLEVRSGFWHSSDLDPTKAANWKRQAATCGEIGVMGDLGMHTLHIPLRLGWFPKRVFAQLQHGYPERPDGKGGMVRCDTWDNAMIHTEIEEDGFEVPMRLEMKRLAPGETNTWFIEVLGSEGAAKFSTKDPKAFYRFSRAKEQSWERIDLGFQTPFATITGGIFEPGFPDVLMQMWASFLAERAGRLDGRFGCVTAEEALQSHRVFQAALDSHRTKRAVEV